MTDVTMISPVRACLWRRRSPARVILCLGVFVAAGWSLGAVAVAGSPSPALTIDQAFARPTYGQTQVGAGFLRIRNDSDVPDVLLAVSSPMAQSAELHSNSMEGDIMRMKRIPEIAIPASGGVTLGPGGMHLMFFHLHAPLEAGGRLPVTLVFAKAGKREVELEVR